MPNGKTVHQSPSPKVHVKKLFSDGTVWRDIDLSNSVLSYQWQLSVDDTAGSFSLQFTTMELPVPSIGGESYIFDDVDIMDIVEIYEETSDWIQVTKKPVFVGVIRSKKYSSQAQEGGGVRRMAVSGTAITGLVSRFKITFDVNACVITKTNINESKITKNLTTELSRELKDEARNVENFVRIVWNYVVKLSGEYGGLSNPTTYNYLKSIIGEVKDIFKVDDIAIYYPLGNVLNEHGEQDVISIIDNILAPPVYEKFSYTDENGKMHIRIREAPFDSTAWNNLNCTILSGEHLKSINLEQTDSEVYTVFFAYLDGSAVTEDFALRIANLFKNGESDVNPSQALQFDSDKYSKYGYQPLTVHFRGYQKTTDEEDGDAVKNIAELTEKMMNWYSHVDEMLKGSVTLAMELESDKGREQSRIMPGERIAMLGGNQFYVEGVSHSWNYGAGGEINLSLSRGGQYSENGKFSAAKEITSYINLLKEGSSTPSIESSYIGFSLNR